MKFSVRKYLPLITILMLCCTSNIILGQPETSSSLNLSGNLQLDSKLIFSNMKNEKTINLLSDNPNAKKPFLAALFSLVLPGAGEFYSEHYVKAIIFLAVEAAAITTAVIYNKKGDDKTNDFQNYANQHWSVNRYADWTLKNLKHLNPELDPDSYQVFNSDGTVNWSELNRLESSIGSGYSHSLPRFGDQQYYELIGKYPQYSHGWDQSNQNDTDFHILTQQFLNYSKERGKANDLYDVAAKAVVAIYVNHFLSALDAYWSTTVYNRTLAVSMRMHQTNYTNRIELVPTINFKFQL